MAKILFVANIHAHFNAFHLPYIEWLIDCGHEVHVAAGGPSTKVNFAQKQFYIPVQRTAFSFKNLKAIKELKKILEGEKYDYIHCHTPIASVVARLAARRLVTESKLKILYTAHGLHFYKGAPILRWLIYYPIEKFLSRYTEALITINQEDFELVHNRNFSNRFTFKIPGIGFKKETLMQTNSSIRLKLRQQYGYDDGDFILIYLARFSKDKNHEFVIKNASSLKKIIPRIKIVFAGDGPQLNSMKKIAKKLGVSDCISFLGFRNDVKQLIALSNIGVSSSKREGFGINIAEEMYAGLPVVAAINRGHKEMIISGYNGFLFDLKKPEEFISYIVELYSSPELQERISNAAMQSIEAYSVDNAKKQMIDIYKQLIPL